MADSIQAWVDPGELRRIGELLMAPSGELPSAEREEAAYGVAFEGYDRPESAPSSPPPDQIVQASRSLAEARRLAEEGGILAAPAKAPPRPPTPSAPAHVHGPGPFLGRMEAFGQWLRGEVGVDAFFLADHQGEVFVDEVGEAKLVQVAQTLAQASRAANSQAGSPVVGSLRVKIAGGRHLEVLPTETHYGFLILGIIVTEVLAPAAAEVVAQGLQRAVAPPNSP